VGGTGAITTVLGGTPRANILLRSCEIAGAVPRFYAGPALRAGGRGSRPGPPIPWGPIPGIYTVYCVVKRLRALSNE